MRVEADCLIVLLKNGLLPRSIEGALVRVGRNKFLENIKSKVLTVSTSPVFVPAVALKASLLKSIMLVSGQEAYQRTLSALDYADALGFKRVLIPITGFGQSMIDISDQEAAINDFIADDNKSIDRITVVMNSNQWCRGENCDNAQMSRSSKRSA
jgi:hypothetical protein